MPQASIDSPMVPSFGSHDDISSQLNQLSQQLSSLSPKLSTSTAAMANAGNSAYVVAKPSSSSWIIDSGASAHMTGPSSVLSNFRPSNSHIVLANGSFRPGLGTGDFQP
jgi:hypothetical protein